MIDGKRKKIKKKMTSPFVFRREGVDALSYLMRYVTQNITQTLKKEIDASIKEQFNETLAAQTPEKASAPVPGISDSENDSPGPWICG